METGITLPAIIAARVTDPVTVIRALNSGGSDITEPETLEALSRSFLRIPGDSALFRALQSARELLSAEEFDILTRRMQHLAPEAHR